MYAALNSGAYIRFKDVLDVCEIVMVGYVGDPSLKWRWLGVGLWGS